VREAEPAADDPAVPELFLDLAGVRIRPDVEVFRVEPEQEVADPAADQISTMAGLVEPIKNLEGVRVDVAAGNSVFGPRDDGWNHDQGGL
jgi:hypothetical protein